MEVERKKKVRTNITIDKELLQKAKEYGLNISRITEKALKATIAKLERD